METSSEFCPFVVGFNGLPEHVTITKSTGCLNRDHANDASSTKLSIEVPVSNKSSSSGLLRAFSQAPSWNVSFPRVFFDRLQYENNVKELMEFFGSWLLGLDVSEDISTQDDLSARCIPDDSGNKNGYSYK